MTYLNEFDRQKITKVGHTALSNCQDGSQKISHEDFVLSLIPEHASMFVVIERQIGPPSVRVF